LTYVAGVDLSSSSVQIMISDLDGNIIVDLNEPFMLSKLKAGVGTSRGWSEQNPDEWVRSIHAVFLRAVRCFKEQGGDLDEIKAICTDSTSGSVLAINDSGAPLAPAMMYNDFRAEEEVDVINEIAGEYCEKLAYVFNPSFGLPKILWMRRHLPGIYSKAFKIIHENDFLVYLLSEDKSFHSDSSNALKTGYDFIDNRWPDYIERDLNISIDKLPVVSHPGEIISTTSEGFEEKTGFPSGVPIISGATDATMALVSSGAKDEGDIFTSVGTTLVTRVVSRRLVRDPHGRFYSHVYPGRERLYLPGGASSAGAECLERIFPGKDFKMYDEKSFNWFPTSNLAYPLMRKGERFPFIDPDATSVFIGKVENEYHRYTTYLEAVAHVERLAISVLEGAGITVGNKVYTVGGGASSDYWLQIRSDVLQKEIYRPRVIESAFGCMIVAAAAISCNGDIKKAASDIIKNDLIVKPRKSLKDKIDKHYNEFLEMIKSRFKVVI